MTLTAGALCLLMPAEADKSGALAVAAGVAVCLMTANCRLAKDSNRRLAETAFAKLNGC